MSTTYRITSRTGVDLGTYEGETAAEALDAMAQDAGYQSYRHACGLYPAIATYHSEATSEELAEIFGLILSEVETRTVEE